MTWPLRPDDLWGMRALVLDVDDTIVDTRAAMVTAGEVALGVLWPDHPGHHAAMAQRYYDDPGRWFRRYASGELSFDAMRRGRIDEVARAFEVTPPEGALARYSTAYDPAFRGAQRLFDDVPRLLRTARAAGLQIALLTNSAAAPTTLKLGALDLLDTFDAVVTTDTLGFGKPDPRVYREACALMGVAAAETVCVGDSLEWDVHGAAAAGLHAVWLDREAGGAVDDVARITDLDALTDALAVAVDQSATGRFGPPTSER